MTQSWLKDSISLLSFAVLAFVVGVYFFHSATEGPFGLYQKGKIEAREAELQQILTQLQATRMESENRVRRLSDDFLDLDLLDERTRSVLGYARMDEVIIR